MPYPPIEPYQTGMLEAGDGNLVYWEACGNPDGVPALIVHGGPGIGLHDRTAPLVRPAAVPDHPVRPAELRSQQAARERPGCRHEPQHNRVPARRHGAAARAARRGQVAAARRIVGRDPLARLRPTPSRPGVRAGAGQRHVDPAGPSSTGSTVAPAGSSRRRGRGSATSPASAATGCRPTLSRRSSRCSSRTR